MNEYSCSRAGRVGLVLSNFVLEYVLYSKFEEPEYGLQHSAPNLSRLSMAFNTLLKI